MGEPSFGLKYKRWKMLFKHCHCWISRGHARWWPHGPYCLYPWPHPGFQAFVARNDGGPLLPPHPPSPGPAHVALPIAQHAPSECGPWGWWGMKWPHSEQGGSTSADASSPSSLAGASPQRWKSWHFWFRCRGLNELRLSEFVQISEFSVLDIRLLSDIWVMYLPKSSIFK